MTTVMSFEETYWELFGVEMARRQILTHGKGLNLKKDPTAEGGKSKDQEAK